MVRRCPHGKRVKNFASCEACNAGINAIAVDRLMSRYNRMLSRTATMGYEKDKREWAEIPTLTLNKITP